MSVKLPPHRPTPGELDAARLVGLPSSDGYVASMLDLVEQARAQGQLADALNVLTSLTLVRPDDRRIYQALGQLYTKLGRAADARACFEEATRLANPPTPAKR